MVFIEVKYFIEIWYVIMIYLQMTYLQNQMYTIILLIFPCNYVNIANVYITYRYINNSFTQQLPITAD